MTSVQSLSLIDNETRVIMDGLASGHIPPSEQPLLHHYARARKEAFRLGVVRAQTYRDVDEFLKRYDDTLQLRFSIEFDCWVVDRWVEKGQYWIQVLAWVDENMQPRRLSSFDKWEMLEILDAGNTQKRYDSPYEYYLSKRRSAKQRQRELAVQREEAGREAWDGLTQRGKKEFIETVNALRTGEEIRSTGQDAKTLEFMKQAGDVHSQSSGQSN